MIIVVRTNNKPYLQRHRKPLNDFFVQRLTSLKSILKKLSNVMYLRSISKAKVDDGFNDFQEKQNVVIHFHRDRLFELEQMPYQSIFCFLR